MSLKNRSGRSSYQSVERSSDDEDNDNVGTELVAKRSSSNNAPPKLSRQQSAEQSDPNLIRAFSEIKFKQHESQQKIKNRLKKKKITKKQATDDLKRAYKTLAHTLDKETLEKEYETSLINGLSIEQVNRLLNDPNVGHNELTPPKRDPEWLRFLKCTFDNLLSILLTVGAILSLIAYGIDPHTPKDPSSLYLGIVLILVVVITGLFIFYQEGKSSNLMSALSAMKPANIMVIRNNGERKEIEPRDLVPGDLVILNMGMLIPADLRIIECSSDLEVDNSSLTGESDPQKRSWKPESNDIIPAESKCLSFFGTLIVNGKGIGLVIQTGDNTFMGRTAALASSTETTKTPIQREIHDFVTKIAFIAMVVGILLFIAAMVLNPDDWITNVILLIGIIITNVPEELMVYIYINFVI